MKSQKKVALIYGYLLTLSSGSNEMNSNTVTYRCSIPSDPITMSSSTSVIIANNIKFFPPRFSFLGLCKCDLKNNQWTILQFMINLRYYECSSYLGRRRLCGIPHQVPVSFFSLISFISLEKQVLTKIPCCNKTS